MNIYVLKNFTLKELYFNVCESDTAAAVQIHKSDPLSPVSHWKWASEEIKWGEVGGDMHESYARAFLTALRRQPPDDGWVMVYGAE